MTRITGRTEKAKTNRADGVVVANGLRTAAKIAEHKLRSRRGGGGQPVDGGADSLQHCSRRRRGEEEQDQTELDRHRSNRQTPRKPPPILRNHPADAHDHWGTAETLQIQNVDHLTPVSPT